MSISNSKYLYDELWFIVFAYSISFHPHNDPVRQAGWRRPGPSSGRSWCSLRQMEWCAQGWPCSWGADLWTFKKPSWKPNLNLLHHPRMSTCAPFQSVPASPTPIPQVPLPDFYHHSCSLAYSWIWNKQNHTVCTLFCLTSWIQHAVFWFICVVMSTSLFLAVLSCIPLYRYAKKIFLSILQLMNFWVVSSVWLLWIWLIWKFLYKSFCRHSFHFSRCFPEV